MTIKECIKKHGLQMEVDELKRYQTVDVCFVNSDGQEDETEFNVRYMGTKQGEQELTNLFKEFCKENGFKTNTVLSVTVVKNSDVFKELDEE